VWKSEKVKQPKKAKKKESEVLLPVFSGFSVFSQNWDQIGVYGSWFWAAGIGNQVSIIGSSGLYLV
jgi:hypothetical protein